MDDIRKDMYRDNNKNQIVDGHKCYITNRNRIELTGVNEVNSFDTNEILLDTKLGGLLIKGNNLHIEQLNLDKGNVDVDGKIDAILYSNKTLEKKTMKSVFVRMFR